MRIEVIPQAHVGGVPAVRVGDVLNRSIADEAARQFEFGVAYMRLSGWSRIAASVGTLLNRGGTVSGAVGVDGGVTSIEALRALREVSGDSTVFYTVSSLIYHPKLYLISGHSQAIAIVGSANLTRDGLFRNIELATAVHLDFEIDADFLVHQRYREFIRQLLNTAHPNVQPVTESTLHQLVEAGILRTEAAWQEYEAQTDSPGAESPNYSVTPLATIFPALAVPVAPAPAPGSSHSPASRPSIVVPPQVSATADTFIMVLSPFDSSHRTGTPGTPEVLIPHDATNFFPAILLRGRQHPDEFFDVVLNTPSERERHNYRIWYYEQRGEYRLRMDNQTIDLMAPDGGDLLIISRLPQGSDPLYEVTILPQSDPTYPAFEDLCSRVAQGKRWGLL